MLGKIYSHLLAPKLHLAAASAAARKAGMSTFRVPGSNMAPTLEPGEVVWVRPVPARQLERGQVVAFTTIDLKGVPVPSRVIGLPGETIQLRDGDLLVNDVRVPEPYLQAGRADQDFSRSFGPQVVPKESVWLMGDFRDMSKDSRHFGALRITSVQGQVVRAHALGAHANPRSVR